MMSNAALSRRGLVKSGAATVSVLALGASPLLGQSEQDDAEIAQAIREAAERLPAVTDPGFARLVDRYAGAKVVLLGEATHGTEEFYRARTAFTERLVREHGFSVVALEADWPDAARIDAHVRRREPLPDADTPFPRFPLWMWRNQAVQDLIARLRALNEETAEPERQVGVYGLDLYSLPSSMDAVMDYARRHDPEVLTEIKARYGCLAPFVEDPVSYGALARGPAADTCAEDVASVAEEVLTRRLGEVEGGDPAVFDAFMNARVVSASEAYHRAMYEGSVASWNLRDTHMFETLQRVLDARGPEAKAIVWAHNSHIGDARATGMGAMGELNLGQLSRQEWGEAAVSIGFGTDRGTVTAATEWDGGPEAMEVNPSLPGSWGALMNEVGVERFFLDLRNLPATLEQALSDERIERFIGVLYLRESERPSHYVPSSLAREYDGYVWMAETTAVEPLSEAEFETLPEGHPFAL